MPPLSATELLRDAAAQLAAAGVAAADWDAERLLRHVTGWDRATLVASPDAAVSAPQELRFRALVAQRVRRVPLQHLVGTQAFWRHEFAVSPAVLIPRPETELLVEAALASLRGRHAPLVIDVGTGSGCIALSLAAERPDARIHATDVSAAALEVARANARRLGLQDRVTFHETDLLGTGTVAEGAFDLIVSNPPYVAETDRSALAPEVRDHEPALALFAGRDGCDVYRRLIPAAAAVLTPGGSVALEIGAGQRDTVAGLCANAGLRLQQVIPDLQAIPRALLAVKAPGTNGSARPSRSGWPTGA